MQRVLALLILCCFCLTACQPAAQAVPAARLKVGLVADSGSEDDKSFNEYTLKGASCRSSCGG